LTVPEALQPVNYTSLQLDNAEATALSYVASPERRIPYATMRALGLPRIGLSVELLLVWQAARVTAAVKTLGGVRIERGVTRLRCPSQHGGRVIDAIIKPAIRRATKRIRD
jgi:hypothetical protein